jgi:hypothetical protein
MATSADSPPRCGFLDFRRRWLQKYTAHSQRQYLRATNRYLEWCEGHGVDPLHATQDELNRFVSFVATTWGSSSARVGAYALASYFRELRRAQGGRAAALTAPRPTPATATRTEADRSIACVTLDQAVEALNAAEELGPVHYALSGLLLETGIAIRAICRLEGRDLRWASDRPIGRVLVRRDGPVEALAYAVSDGLFDCLRGFYSGPGEVLMTRGDPPHALTSHTAPPLLAEVMAEAGLPASIGVFALRAFAQERDRRKRNFARIGRGEEKGIRWHKARDTVPIDQRPPDVPTKAEDILAMIEREVVLHRGL